MIPPEKSFFRGQELPRLLLLTALLAAGLVFFWNYIYFKDLPAAEPVPAVEGPPPPVETDKAPEFQSVTDKTPIALRDMAAYALLLERARETPPAALSKQARRDVFYSHLWERPEHYRGVPVHLLGTAWRVLRYESKQSKTGWLYEAWIVLPDIPKYPFVCVFEEPPKGFPIGLNVSERVVFDGYFLKLMAYQAGDVPRAAPLLIGRIGWTPSSVAGKAGKGHLANGPFLWMSMALAFMFIVSFFRWMTGLRRTLAVRLRSSVAVERPNDVISADELARWVESVPEDEADHGDSPAH